MENPQEMFEDAVKIIHSSGDKDPSKEEEK